MSSKKNLYSKKRGFTLIELSIVLVVIGLIVGGVLVGQDLIKAAQVRATISQVDKYNTAVNTFRGKFGYLPGDINAAAAATFGFAARGQYAGEGDGNGTLQGVLANSSGENYPNVQGTGETSMFWVDLSSAMAGNLIEGGFNTASSTTVTANIAATNLSAFFPAAKLGGGNYFYVFSGGYAMNPGPSTGDSLNYFGLSAVSNVASSQIISGATLTVAQAYNIDKKVDDGFPMSGNVTAGYLNGNGWYWAGTGGNGSPPYTTGVAGTSITCFDNGGTNGATMNYSLEISNGSYANCGLSFRFQ